MDGWSRSTFIQRAAIGSSRNRFIFQDSTPMFGGLRTVVNPAANIMPMSIRVWANQTTSAVLTANFHASTVNGVPTPATIAE